jgi:hypothetical protein
MSTTNARLRRIQGDAATPRLPCTAATAVSPTQEKNPTAAGSRPLSRPARTWRQRSAKPNSACGRKMRPGDRKTQTVSASRNRLLKFGGVLRALSKHAQVDDTAGLHLAECLHEARGDGAGPRERHHGPLHRSCLPAVIEWPSEQRGAPRLSHRQARFRRTRSRRTARPAGRKAARSRPGPRRVLLRKTFGFEVLHCPCGARREVLAAVTDWAQIDEQLRKRGLEPSLRPTAMPRHHGPRQAELSLDFSPLLDRVARAAAPDLRRGRAGVRPLR